MKLLFLLTILVVFSTTDAYGFLNKDKGKNKKATPKKKTSTSAMTLIEKKTSIDTQNAEPFPSITDTTLKPTSKKSTVDKLQLIEEQHYHGNRELLIKHLQRQIEMKKKQDVKEQQLHTKSATETKPKEQNRRKTIQRNRLENKHQTSNNKRNRQGTKYSSKKSQQLDSQNDHQSSIIGHSVEQGTLEQSVDELQQQQLHMQAKHTPQELVHQDQPGDNNMQQEQHLGKNMQSRGGQQNIQMAQQRNTRQLSQQQQQQHGMQLAQQQSNIMIPQQQSQQFQNQQGMQPIQQQSNIIVPQQQSQQFQNQQSMQLSQQSNMLSQQQQLQNQQNMQIAQQSNMIPQQHGIQQSNQQVQFQRQQQQQRLQQVPKQNHIEQSFMPTQDLMQIQQQFQNRNSIQPQMQMQSMNMNQPLNALQNENPAYQTIQTHAQIKVQQPQIRIQPLQQQQNTLIAPQLQVGQQTANQGMQSQHILMPINSLAIDNSGLLSERFVLVSNGNNQAPTNPPPSPTTTTARPTTTTTTPKPLSTTQPIVTTRAADPTMTKDIESIKRQFFQKEVRKQDLEITKLELEIRALRRTERLGRMPMEIEIEPKRKPRLRPKPKPTPAPTTTTVMPFFEMLGNKKMRFPFDF